MRKYSLLIGCLSLLLIGTSNPLQALDLGVSYAIFSTPSAEMYLEVNLEIAPASITWIDVDSTHVKTSADVLILVKKGDQVFAYEKYLLNSPSMTDPITILDVKRLIVTSGEYELEVTVQDHAKPDNQKVFRQTIQVNIPKQLYLTEVQLMRSIGLDTSSSAFAKNGFYLEPLPFNFYDRNATTLAFYAEIYNSNTTIKDPTYLIRYVLERQKGNNLTDLIAVKTQKKRPSVLEQVMMQMDITNVETGNYSITVEVRNTLNELLASKRVDFQRSNPFLQIEPANLTEEVVSKQFVKDIDEKELIYSLKAITPLITSGSYSEEIKNALATNDFKAMRFILFRHYVSQDANNPEIAWKNYMDVARKVDDKFHSGFRHGFETDRGRMFLRYGTPDDLVHVEDDPSAPPYEIWVYYNFPKTQQRNVKFLFYNPSLAGEDYVVLHSTARGETSNPKWERVLYRRNAGEQYQGDNDFDATSMQRNTNRNARAYFEDF